ncbi:MAG TPA: TetR family transcriptional regulator [Gemmatimonadaceae bacterium]|nr:TetR family transcriptional regulator [Gemmatimonadaceae bacterium]
MIKKRKRSPTRASTSRSARKVPRGKAAVVPDGETERRILEAARTVFVRHGTAGARMQEIARAAGVNQALLHYYFRSKERLAAAVFQMVAGRMLPALIGTLGSDLPLEEKCDRVIALYIANLTVNPFLAAYLISELHHRPERAAQLLGGAIGADPGQVVPPIIEKLSLQIQEGVAAGRIRSISPQQFVVNLVSLCVFPFAARPMLSVILALDDKEFARFIDVRKTELPAFFHNALRP